jgi:hypothetical protein
MSININGASITTNGTDIKITSTSGNTLMYQNANGYTYFGRKSNNTANIPLFYVGLPNTGWSFYSGVLPFNYTSGSGYQNVDSCFNTSNYRFTVTQRGFHLFRYHTYIYGNNSTAGWYVHPNYTVNGSFSTRRLGPIYRMRLYGLYANNGQDTDNCELMYLYPGDYVEAYVAPNGTVEHYNQYSSFAGFYLGDIQ